MCDRFDVALSYYAKALKAELESAIRSWMVSPISIQSIVHRHSSFGDKALAQEVCTEQSGVELSPNSPLTILEVESKVEWLEARSY